jgi:ABC-type Fe3+/spermidine/putrescine transport system ATPase subunit
LPTDLHSGPRSGASIAVRDLHVAYGGTRVLHGVSIDFTPGSFTALLGSSGCGKTTLLRSLSGFVPVESGSIIVGGQDVALLPPEKRGMAMVFQSYALWPHMTVLQNVEYPLRARGVGGANRTARAREVLRIVQCDHLEARLPAMLSGGQQQRVALARALASKPAVMLLDEPLSNLDALLRVELRSQLRAIHRELHFTGIYVTHDQIEAFSLGTRVAVMNAGRIEQIGAPDVVHAHPATEYVARFLGISNAVAVANDGAWRGSFGKLEGDLSIFEKVRSQHASLFIRPERVQLGGTVQPGRAIAFPAATVADAVFMGDDVEYVVKAGEETLLARVPGTTIRYNPGDAVRVSVGHEDLLVYSDGKLVSDARAA